MAKKAVVEQVLRDTSLFDARNDSDTVRLWEGYREQAALWRVMALIQIPSTALAIALAGLAWMSTRPIINVPEKPLPGMYAAQELPDTEFIEFTTDYVNLISSYQPYIAERQFLEARKMLIEPALSVFKTEMLGTELQAITNTSRSQLFFIDPSKTQLVRNGRDVGVIVQGDRFKLVAGREIPATPLRYTVVLTTVPRNSLNPYGIVIKNVKAENIEL